MDKSYLDKVYRDNYQSIFNYLSRTVDSDNAEDLTQEVFIKVFNSIDTFENKSSINTWIYRIATNCLIDFMRKNKIVTNRCKLSDKELFSKAEIEYLDEEFRIVQEEMKECICSYIKILPTRYRVILILKEYDSKSLEEIMSIMNISKENVKKTLQRARKKLKEILTEQCTFYYNEKNTLSCEKVSPL